MSDGNICFDTPKAAGRMVSRPLTGDAAVRMADMAAVGPCLSDGADQQELNRNDQSLDGLVLKAVRCELDNLSFGVEVQALLLGSAGSICHSRIPHRSQEEAGSWSTEK